MIERNKEEEMQSFLKKKKHGDTQKKSRIKKREKKLQETKICTRNQMWFVTQ